MLHLILLTFAQADRIDELIRSSAELHSFTAVYQLSAGDAAESTRLRIDFEAPARVRVERSAPGVQASTWCVDGMLAVVSNEGGKPVSGRYDSALYFTELAPTEQALRVAFPGAESRPELAAAVGVRWSFDEKGKQPEFKLEADLRDPSATPLGWLLALRDKDAPAREDGDRLRFDLDGRFQLALSRQSGFLEEFSAGTPPAQVHVTLVSLDLNQPIDPARFLIPATAAAGTDASADMARGVGRLAQLGLRNRIYAAIAGQAGDAPWDEAMRTKIGAVLRTFHQRTVSETMAPWIEKSHGMTSGITERLAGMRKDGKSAEEIEVVRQREIGYLTKRLDTLESGFDQHLTVPKQARSLPRAEELLTEEKRVVLDIFRSQVREPMLQAFLQATAP